MRILLFLIFFSMANTLLMRKSTPVINVSLMYYMKIAKNNLSHEHFVIKHFRCYGKRNPIDIFGRIGDLESSVEKIDFKLDALNNKIDSLSTTATWVGVLVMIAMYFKT